MKTRILGFFIFIPMFLSLLMTGCMYNQVFYKDKLILRGYESTIFGIPIGTQYVVMVIDPLDSTYDFYIKFPDGNIYRSSEIQIETFKNIENVIIRNEDLGTSYSYYPLPGGILKNPTGIAISTKNNITIDEFYCYAEHHCNSPKRFYFSSAKDKEHFYPMPITHEQAVKIFGEPDKVTSRLPYWGL